MITNLRIKNQSQIFFKTVFIYLFIYLAAVGLPYSMQNL